MSQYSLFIALTFIGLFFYLYCGVSKVLKGIIENAGKDVARVG